MSENPRDPLKEGYFHCAGNSLSGISDTCHMPVSVNYSACCYHKCCIFTVNATLTYIVPVTGTQGLLAPSVYTASIKSTWWV
jgi:hypothetical protein